MGTRRYTCTVVVCLFAFVACGDNKIPATGDDTPIECTAPEVACGDSCVNISTDEANCGSCDNPCAGSQVCINGDCQAKVTCSGNDVDCGNVCTNTQSDEENCGACGNKCSASQTCVSGSCQTTVSCTLPMINCNNTCIDPRTDENNCGACGAMCTGTQTCVNVAGTGTCQSTVSCTSPQIDCNNVCVDPRSDEANCGGCGNMCTASQTCVANGNSGSCQTTANCTPPQEDCNNVCVNKQTDDNNCGTCGNMCSGATPDCVAGVCSPICSGTTPNLCNGTCTNTLTDEMNCSPTGACGTQCAVDETCTAGFCVDTCTTPEQFCSGVCINTTNNNANCGACGAICPGGTVCSNSTCVLNCQPPTPNLCGASCTNNQTDNLNCGSCGNQCIGGTTCQAGSCLCPPGQTSCNGQCTDTREDDNNCGPPGPGSCGDACLPTENCDLGVCELDCTVPLLDCGGTTCANPANDNANCGSCGNACTGELSCVGGSCACTVAGETRCPAGGNQCVDTQNDNANCGSCGNACPGGQFCSGGTCQLSCAPLTLCNPPGVCADLTNDPENCGVCGNNCGIGGICGSSTCSCPANIPNACPGLCTNFNSDPGHCGNCQTACDVGAGELCSIGKCCPQGTVNCNGVCRDLDDDELACGSCGVQCGAGETCTNGQCDCPFGQQQCVPPGGGPPVCKTTVNDPDACGPTCATCSGATPFCVSNGCAAMCPAPLEGCTEPDGDQICVNQNDDNNHCGACNTPCAPGTGCSNGTCVPKIVVGPDPAKCVGGGPPIIVPGGDPSDCTGGLSGVTFRFGLCSCTNVGPLGHNLLVDAFDSRFGPYVTSPTSKRMGGGIGVNGTIQNTANIEAFGDFWVFGAQGQATKGQLRVHDRFFNKFAFSFKDLTSINEGVLGSCTISNTNCFSTADCPTGGGTCNLLTFPQAGEDATIGGAISKSGGGGFAMNVSGTLTSGTTACGALAGQDVSFGACNSPVAFPALDNPCDCAPGQMIPVRSIVDFWRTNNDNALIGLSSQALNGGSSARLDLPCGIYYFDQVNISQATTIVVHGRTAIAIGGSVVVSQPIIFDLDPTATLDVFVAGVVKASQDFTVGSPAFPRLARMYIGSPGCAGSGSCSVNADCCSGVCQANGQCTGGGGGNISESFSLSGNSFLNGLMYSGFGTFRVTNPLIMNGAIFTGYYDSVEANIHFDKGAVDNSDECPPQPPNQGCTDCRDCDNQACINGVCTQCQQDSDCCSPLRCVGGSCSL